MDHHQTDAPRTDRYVWRLCFRGSLVSRESGSTSISVAVRARDAAKRIDALLNGGTLAVPGYVVDTDSIPTRSALRRARSRESRRPRQSLGRCVSRDRSHPSVKVRIDGSHPRWNSQGENGSDRRRLASGSLVVGDLRIHWTLDIRAQARVRGGGLRDTSDQARVRSPEFLRDHFRLDWNKDSSPALFEGGCSATSAALLNLIPGKNDPTYLFEGLANIDGSVNVQLRQVGVSIAGKLGRVRQLVRWEPPAALGARRRARQAALPRGVVIDRPLDYRRRSDHIKWGWESGRGDQRFIR